MLLSAYTTYMYVNHPKKNRKHGTSFANTSKYELYIKKNSLVILRSKQLNLHVTTEIQRGPLARVYYIVHKHMMKMILCSLVNYIRITLKYLQIHVAEWFSHSF